MHKPLSILLAATAWLMAQGHLAMLRADSIESQLDSLKATLKEQVPGTLSLNFRVRYEEFVTPTVDRKGFSARLRYGYTTPEYSGFTAMIEGESLWALFNANRMHPLDQQGRGTELNQLFVRWRDAGLGAVTLGRQIYVLDNQRFIGHVGWRQNIQTFDALTGVFTGVPGTAISAFYIDKVHRVNGSNESLNGWGLNVRYSGIAGVALTGFAYLLDFDRQAAWSADTFGVRVNGTVDQLGKLNYDLSIAYQTDNPGSGSRDFGLWYYAATVSLPIDQVTLGAGFEILEGDGRNGFKTPLATVHAFNGFSDTFLPVAGFAQGLEDLFLFASYRIPLGNGVATRLSHHWFSPQTGSGNYGNEWNFTASYRLSKYFELVGKYGRYRPSANAIAPGAAAKDMLTLEVNFTF